MAGPLHERFDLVFGTSYDGHFRAHTRDTLNGILSSMTSSGIGG
jgi:hypothetical protein